MKKIYALVYYAGLLFLLNRPHKYIWIQNMTFLPLIEFHLTTTNDWNGLLYNREFSNFWIAFSY